MEHGTKRFEMTRARRVANAVIGGAVAYGLGPRELHLLTTRGARTGFLRTTPVSLIENTDGRFLVAPYGEVGWVRNIRKDGYATLRRGGWIELVSVVEVSPERAAPVLREYLDGPRAAVVGPYFRVGPDASLEEFEREAAHHPVFEIVRSTVVRI
ncbi:nitroreductase family deazaflavin-dependent oxidoreductase [Thermobifida halotolerans]|uniref:Nitroreductase family deazaflavin-dependent oxidoreductase n=1 Tax=Thermobifida halotolerans TaxID=483545 RepID=A0A399G5A6_9ACTN|nr:nitroreductase/quinone reductase family protein [Thermobifida halotolerans]UOE20182.1 nitroreductase family deazaflavin-dependent oxidoreductase [Thermobifida halotolerans]